MYVLELYEKKEIMMLVNHFHMVPERLVLFKIHHLHIYSSEFYKVCSFKRKSYLNRLWTGPNTHQCDPFDWITTLFCASHMHCFIIWDKEIILNGILLRLMYRSHDKNTFLSYNATHIAHFSCSKLTFNNC